MYRGFRCFRCCLFFCLQWFLRVLSCFRAYGLFGFRGFQTGFTTFGSKIRNPAQKKVREG